MINIFEVILFYFSDKDRSSTVSTVYTSEGNTNKTIEVGQGSLKLLYSADEGKLARYINSRNMVQILPGFKFIVYFYLINLVFSYGHCGYK